jgi:hypothetical protein
MIRICPKCNAQLGMHDSFFCNLCGFKLPKDLINTNNSSVRVKPYSIEFQEKKKKIKKKINIFEPSAGKKVIFETLGIIIAAAVLFLILRYYLLPSMQNIFSEEPTEKVLEQKDLHLLDLGLSFVSAEFGTESLISYVPAKADIYFESHDLEKFIALFIEKDDFDAELLEIAPGLLQGHFALFGMSEKVHEGWTFIFTPRDGRIVAKVLENVPDGYWVFAQIDDKLIMTTDESILLDITETRKGVVLNLGLNTNYARNLLDVPKNGQALVVFVNEGGAKLLNVILKQDVKSNFADVINTVLESGYKGLVIN